MQNFALFDLFNILFALAVWFVLAVTQGFVIGCLTDVFEFRSCGFSRQLSLATLFSMCVTPCLYNFIAIGTGLNCLVLASLVVALAFFAILVKARRRVVLVVKHIPRYIALNRLPLGLAAGWILLSLFLLVDFQVGEKLYPSLMMLDHSAKVAIADTLDRTGLPPTNSTFYPGHTVPVFYHYYWTMLCELASAVCGRAHDTRTAVLAGIIWAGVVFINGIGLGARYFQTIAASRTSVLHFALVLPVVANFYVLISFTLNVIAFFLHYRPFKSAASICWWTADPVYPFVQTIFWAPHHACGLIAGFMASVCLLEVGKPGGTALKKQSAAAVLGAVCLSSAAGLSSYVAVGFAASWIAWSIFSFFQRRFIDSFATVSVALLGLIFTIPFLHELLGGAKGVASLMWAVRRFELLDWFVPILQQTPKFAHQLAYLVILPVNFVFGFGFLLLGSVFYWRMRQLKNLPIERLDLFLLTLTFVTLTLATFVRSRFNGNDFGWRVFLPAQMAFLLWSAQYLAYMAREKLKLQYVSKLAITVGVATFFYAAYLDRTSPFNYLPGEMSYDRRLVYEKLDVILPLNAVVQHNPHLTNFVTDMYALLYSHRQVVCSERVTAAAANGIDIHEYDQVGTRLEKLFLDPTLAEAMEICQSYKINVLIVKDDDPIWGKSSSWLSHFPIIASSRHVRAYEIQKLAGAR